MWQIGRDEEPHRRATADADKELQLAKTRSMVASKALRDAKTSAVAMLSPAAAAAEASRHPHVWRRPMVVPPPKRYGAVPPKPLPNSVERGASQRVAAVPEVGSHAYQWVPYHVRVNEPSTCASSHCTLEAHGTGTYVNTLTFDMRKETFWGATPQVLRVDPEHFVPKGGRPWCYRLNGSTPCVVLKGLVVCSAPYTAQARDHDLLVGRLPEDMRPNKPLRFAILARDQTLGASTSSRLVTVVAHPDGRLALEPGRSGKDEVTEGCIMDLSGIRFCMGNGIALIDEVLMYMCDVNGTRVICLQGSMGERFFNVHGRKALSLLPASCRPRAETFFVAPGTSGGYHLLQVRPYAPERGLNGAGDLVWKDSKWHRDTICVNGLMWEATEEAALLDNPMAATTASESQVISIMDFQKYLIRRFGSIETAWHEAFDTDGSGSLNFTEFGMGCKASGYVGNATKLWAALDIDRSGEISLEELAADTESMLEEAREHTRLQIEEAKRLEAQESQALSRLNSSRPPSRESGGSGMMTARKSIRDSAPLSARTGTLAATGGHLLRPNGPDSPHSARLGLTR